MFLRNEPTDFGGKILWNIFIQMNLGRLQRGFAGGFVFGNEPTGRGFGEVMSKNWVRFRREWGAGEDGTVTATISDGHDEAWPSRIMTLTMGGGF